jgi:twitching motility protein PilJ
MAWTIRTKLYASFGMVLFIMAVIGVVNWQNTRSIVAASTRPYDNGATQSAVTIAAEKSARMQMILLVLAVLAGGGVAVLLTSNTGRQVRRIMDTCNQINKADYTARVEVVSQDELGAMATSLNAVLDHTLTLMLQSQQERDSMQASIMKLLEEVTDVAEGDLTLEAEVTEDATGVIADSFNYMIHQLRGVVARVQETTLQVSASANEVQSTAAHLAEGSTVQATQIVESSAAIDEMTVSIQQVSEHAALSATVAEQALANARQGTTAVQNTIQGMSRIRAQVQETAKRIKRLGERSQEIGAIVQLIGDIAERTSILALNASIQAARAGEAGRAFVVVAEEVERLAERASNATRQIASLVSTIQSETHEAVIAMEGSTGEVVQGSQLADQAGQALSEIESVSERLAELIQSISHASTQQARSSESLSKAMSEIAAVTQRTAAGTKQATGSINHLAVLADELRHSVSTFKLPVTTNGHSHRM